MFVCVPGGGERRQGDVKEACVRESFSVIYSIVESQHGGGGLPGREESYVLALLSFVLLCFVYSAAWSALFFTFSYWLASLRHWFCVLLVCLF